MAKIITLQFKDLESLQFFDYATSQGSIFKYTTDEPALTATIREQDQDTEDSGLGSELDDFHENWDHFEGEDFEEAPGVTWMGRMGITGSTITN